jgi:hypothetical protein
MILSRSFALFALSNNTLFILGVMIMAVFILRFMLRPKRSAKSYHSPLATEENATSMIPPPELGRWEVQMHDVARNLMGELNTKIAVVEQLVRDANAAAERLEKAIERSNQGR